MNAPAPEPIETDLRRLTPARPPEDFLARLAAARPLPRSELQRAFPQPSPQRPWWQLLGWLVPATAAAAVVAWLNWPEPGSDSVPPGPSGAAVTGPSLTADAVEVDRRLVAAFEAVAQWPGGEPVRFQCREWTEAVIVRDSARGVEIEQRTPHLEIVPVGLDAY